MAVAVVAINSTINASINKALFEIPYGKITPLPDDYLLPRESSINPHAYMFGSKMKQQFNKIKSPMYDA